MLGRDIEKITLSRTANLSAQGNALANTITGNTSANVLDGGLGSDKLTGGTGKDVFQFSTELGIGNIDRITDFKVVDDTIALDDAIFTSLAAASLQTAFYKGATAQGAENRILYDSATGALWYDADGNGEEIAVQFAMLAQKLALTSADFMIV